MPHWLVETLVISLVLILSLSEARADKYCDAFTMRAYDCQFDRQHGEECNWQPVTRIEQAMSREIWGQPQFFSDDKKQTRAAEFANEWKAACLKGEYQ